MSSSRDRIPCRVRMEDESEVRMDLKLDCTEFRGALNFSLFRDSVLALLSRLSETLRDEDTVLPVMRMMDESGQSTSSGDSLVCQV